MRRVPGLEGLDLLVEVAGVAGLVGGLDVDEEQVGAVLQRRASAASRLPS